MSHGAQDAPDVSQVVAQLAKAISGLQICRFSNAAAAAIYIWGIFTSLDDEVKYFWSSFRWTLPNILYIINRYICVWFFLNLMYDFSGLHGEYSTAYCRKFVGVIGVLLAHLAFSGIQTIRVVALWKSTRWLVVVIWCLWALAMAGISTMTIILYFGITANMTYNSHIRMCSTTSVPKLLVFGPVPQTVYELFLTILTVIKTCQFVTISRHNLPPLIHIMARDGVLYFLMASCISIGNVLCWQFLPPQLTNVVLYLWWAIMSTLTSYLTLNLRKVYQGKPQTFTRTTMVTGGTNANITFTNAPDNMQGHTLTQDVGNKSSEAKINLTLRGSRFIMGEGEFEVDLHPENLRSTGVPQTDLHHRHLSAVQSLQGAASQRVTDIEAPSPVPMIPLADLTGRGQRPQIM
ncbi:hypothetical protein PIIN_00496 [Serendipita indica DSM 11827]|uniref:DUF6533 domain-containing protein n=1 Tax=Serendipita indica (strain DSM 11827) TaxID=1109443 RepID=G4U2S9_SERID|nr:hypothetical protein PIIN_00496 [Serendipita indica DSM 11827]